MIFFTLFNEKYQAIEILGHITSVRCYLLCYYQGIDTLECYLPINVTKTLMSHRPLYSFCCHEHISLPVSIVMRLILSFIIVFG